VPQRRAPVVPSRSVIAPSAPPAPFGLSLDFPTTEPPQELFRLLELGWVELL
jgi:hypothetical protein